MQRYLVQMLAELGALPDPDDSGRTLLEGVELIVPHQANKTMILNLADKAGLSADQLYFNVDRMGNVSAASIPIALDDAVRDGAISRRTLCSSPPASGAACWAGTPCCKSTRQSWRTRWCWTSSRPQRRRRGPEAPPTTCAAFGG